MNPLEINNIPNAEKYLYYRRQLLEIEKLLLSKSLACTIRNGYNPNESYQVEYHYFNSDRLLEIVLDEKTRLLNLIEQHTPSELRTQP